MSCFPTNYFTSNLSRKRKLRKFIRYKKKVNKRISERKTDKGSILNILNKLKDKVPEVRRVMETVDQILKDMRRKEISLGKDFDEYFKKNSSIKTKSKTFHRNHQMYKNFQPPHNKFFKTTSKVEALSVESRNKSPQFQDYHENCKNGNCSILAAYDSTSFTFNVSTFKKINSEVQKKISLDLKSNYGMTIATPRISNLNTVVRFGQQISEGSKFLFYFKSKTLV